MQEDRLEFWAQPDADFSGIWAVCKNPNRTVMISTGMTKEDAEDMAARLNALGQQTKKARQP